MESTEQTDSFPRDWNWEMPLYIPNQPTGRYHSTVTSFCSSYLQWTLTSCEKLNHSSATSSQQPLANMCAVLNWKIEFLHKIMQWEKCFRIKKLSIFAHSSAVESLSFPISGWEPRTLAVQTLSMFSLLPVIKARVKVKSATGRGEQRAHVARNQPQPCSHETVPRVTLRVLQLWHPCSQYSKNGEGANQCLLLLKGKFIQSNNWTCWLHLEIETLLLDAFSCLLWIF